MKLMHACFSRLLNFIWMLLCCAWEEPEIWDGIMFLMMWRMLCISKCLEGKLLARLICKTLKILYWILGKLTENWHKLLKIEKIIIDLIVLLKWEGMAHSEWVQHAEDSVDTTETKKTAHNVWSGGKREEANTKDGRYVKWSGWN